jgi:hypothetical protein
MPEESKKYSEKLTFVAAESGNGGGGSRFAAAPVDSGGRRAPKGGETEGAGCASAAKSARATRNLGRRRRCSQMRLGGEN